MRFFVGVVGGVRVVGGLGTLGAQEDLREKEINKQKHKL